MLVPVGNGPAAEEEAREAQEPSAAAGTLQAEGGAAHKGSRSISGQYATEATDSAMVVQAAVAAKADRASAQEAKQQLAHTAVVVLQGAPHHMISATDRPAKLQRLLQARCVGPRIAP